MMLLADFHKPGKGRALTFERNACGSGQVPAHSQDTLRALGPLGGSGPHVDVTPEVAYPLEAFLHMACTDLRRSTRRTVFLLSCRGASGSVARRQRAQPGDGDSPHHRAGKAASVAAQAVSPQP